MNYINRNATNKAMADIRAIAMNLPKGERNRIQNRLDDISRELRKAERRALWGRSATAPQESHDQIAARYVANEAIFQAMRDGRHITLKDSREFGVSEMHTQICTIRKKLAKGTHPYIMQSAWVEDNGVRFKEYWLEEKENNN